MIEGFLHPGLVWGALLAAIPLIIHLLNRRRHRPLAWGAMRFVALAHKRTRRRALLEDLLLLALRMGAVVLLAFALARPFAQGEGLLGQLTEARRNLALIIDASASTGYRPGLESTFDRILTAARERVAKLDGARGDRVLLVWGDDQPRLVAWRSPEEALALLGAGQAPSDGVLDLGAALGVVEEALTDELFFEDGAALDLVLLSDAQRGLFESRLNGNPEAALDGSPATPAPGTAAARPAYLATLDRLQERGLFLTVEDLSGDSLGTNAGVTALTLAGPARGPGMPLELIARIHNRSSGPRPAARVALFIDGVRAPTRSVDLPADGAAETSFSLSFDAPGPHLVEAALDGDALPVDDRRALVVEVPRPLSILGINGAPDRENLENDELGFFTAVLAPPDDGRLGLLGLSPFQVETVDAVEFARGERDLAGYDLFVLANVDNLPRDQEAELLQAVQAGAGLVISLGDRTDPGQYAERLFRADGTGLLPAEPVARIAVPSRRDAYFRVLDFDARHPILSFFADERWRPYLTEIPFFEFIEVRPLADARVLAHLDERDAPLLVERSLGQGKLLLFTSTFDAAWTRFPESPRSFVPFVHELCFYAGRRPATVRNVALGQALRAELKSFPRSPQVLRPDGTKAAVTTEAKALDERRWSLELTPAARRVGAWRLELEGQASELFSVGFDGQEGDLERIGPAELQALHPGLRARAAEAAEASQERAPAQGEWWRPLVALTLTALLLESLLSGWLSFRRGDLRARVSP